MHLVHIFVLLLVFITGVSLSVVTGEVQIITPESISIPDNGSPGGLQAEFSGAPTSGRTPLLVLFTDLTKGNPSRWVWDFGDGNSAFSENPIHSYDLRGTYTVRLTVYSQDGESNTVVKKDYITARPVFLEANFTAEPASGRAPLTVQFTDRSVGAVVWLWNFGDGSIESMLPNPSHTFIEPGVYPVVLKVSNELGETEIHKQEITVSSDEKPEAGFIGSPTSGAAPLTVQFTDQSRGTVAAWLWNFGDGCTDTSRNPLHTYLKSGIYPVNLTVSSENGNSDSELKMNYISVTDSPVSGSILLSPGWNFVSVPAILASGKDTAEIFLDVDADGHSAFQYNPVSGGWIPLTRYTPIRPLEAYWIYSKKNDMIPLSFTYVTGQVPSRKLVKGWNAVGFSGLNPVEARQALSSVRDTWQNCIGFNRELQRYNEMIFKGVNDNTRVQPYGGYWVYMSAEGVLSGSVS